VNRLILVGNGFDLAHGLKTSYKDFIDDFWEGKINEIKYSESNSSYEDEYIKVYRVPNSFPAENIFKTYQDLIKHIPNLKIKNKFLELLSQKRTYLNWVDIEKEYYNELKKCTEPRFPFYDVDDLNSDFIKVKELLINYLIKIEKVNSINRNICDKIYKHFKILDFSLEARNKKIEIEYDKRKKSIEAIESSEISLSEFNDDLVEFNILTKLIGADKKSNIREMLENPNREIIEKFNLYPQEILFLNFNYTDTISNYVINKYCNRKETQTNFNNIHGNLKEKEINPIIFGFGDDVDKRYQEFEDLDDNRYLENFKSIAYSQTDHYKRLLEFIESDNFQVFIFGHSCGISDRTMLNTIFEHDNCKSIKPFYHKREDGTDNYTEIVQNISRNFNDKKKYRDRVVNKTYCEPLT
jgi:hypothetical protein